MSERNSTPINAPKITRPGESSEFTGSRNITEFLPAIFRTDSNKQFLDTTLEQLMSSGSLMSINNMIGKKIATDANFLRDNRESDNYQFVPGNVIKDKDGVVESALTYDDLINTLAFDGVNVNKQNQLLNEKGHTLDLPINYDMFINYQKYFWTVDVLPPCSIKPTSSDVIDIDTIFDDVYYTTPTLSTNNTLELMNGMRIRFMPTQIDRTLQTVLGNQTFNATVVQGNVVKVYKNNQLVEDIPSNYTYNSASGVVTFVTAPAVDDEIEIHTFYAYSTSGNYAVGDIYIVDGVGSNEGIKLTKQFTSGQVEGTYSKRNWMNRTVYSSLVPTEFDAAGTSFDFTPYDLSEFRMTERDYVVEQRWSTDQSAWARSNLWIHETAALAVVAFENLDQSTYLPDNFRGVRPIIEFRANIEKHNFGQRHIAYVDRLIEAEINPFADIVGLAEYNHATYNINTVWSEKGFTKSDKVKLVMTGDTTYWECQESHGVGKNPSYYENRKYWKQISGQNLENDDLVMFLRTIGGTSANKIYKVTGVGSSINLTELYGNSSTPLIEGDKVVVLFGYNTLELPYELNSDPYSGSEWHWNGTRWIYGQQKTHKSASMLTSLYDTTLTSLSNLDKYPNSNFVGDRIFDFGRSSSTAYDNALGFSPSYVDYGNTPGLNFDFGAGANRYNYILDDIDTSNTATLEIPGYYYYKIGTRYYNSWSEIRDGQPVRRHIQKTVGSDPSTIDINLGTSDYNKPTEFRFQLRDNLLTASTVTSSRTTSINGTLPDLYMPTNTTISIQTLFHQGAIEFTKFDGTALSNVTRTAGVTDRFDLVIGAMPDSNIIKYRYTGSSEYGIIRLYDETNATTISVTKNGEAFTNYTTNGKILSINSGLVENDVYDITFYTDSELDVSAEGYFEPADTQIYNPQNKTLTTASFGDMVSHISEQMESIPVFTGDYFGTNNYDKIGRVHQFRGTIRQQPFSTELLNVLATSNDTDIYSSLKHAANSYEKFKKQFAIKVQQLHNDIPQETTVYEIVDIALSQLTIGKNSNSAFANSNMAMFRDYKSKDYTFTNTMSKTFDLPETVNTYDDAQNHIQVWLKHNNSSGDVVWQPLLKNLDYTITNTQVTVTKTVVYPINGASVHIRWYPQNAVSFIPSSAVKLGLVRPYTTEITASELRGHDGSVHTRKGTELYDRNKVGFDPVDACLWDLENRIYNNLQASLKTIPSYLDIIPSPYRPTPYTQSDVDSLLKNEYTKWISKNTVADSIYDITDKFTWNYSKVEPYIGHWKGIYQYYFRTHRPHTHPWEILGYNEKPTWWDANYSWTDPSSRLNLLNAIARGIYNDPADAIKKYDINLATGYNVVNNLVTTGGVLNDPVTAGVVTWPTYNTDIDFVYGDLGPAEAAWQETSEYQIVKILALMKLRPLWVTNSYFRSNERQLLDTSGIENVTWINKSELQLTNNIDVQISGLEYENSIIQSIRVIDPGNGFTSAPELSVYSNFGKGARLQAYILSGKISGVSVENPGSNYYNKPTISASTGSIKLEAILANDARKYFVGLNNAVVEFAKFNGTPSDTIINRFKYTDFSPILKVGGFVNPANQHFVLRSSQDKGATRIPEENYTGLLYTSKPSKEVFFGGIIITDTDNGYTINGFDNSDQFFTYNSPITSSNQTIVVGPIDVVKYSKFETATTRIPYNTTLSGVQEVFNFIQGYGYYLQSQGWTASWRSVADDFITWAAGDTTSIPLKIIPTPKSIQISDGDIGYYDTLNKTYDGVYNILDENGKQLATDKVIVKREFSNSSHTEISVKDPSSNIYGVRLYKVTVEHAIVFDTTTKFDDVVYDPVLGQLHRQLTWKGNRTKDWTGKFYSPGYIIDGASIYQNFDTTARELDQYYGPSNSLSNKQIVDAARFNTGYNKPAWSEKLDLDDDTLFDFMKGTRKYRGTRFAVDAFVRNKGLFDSDAAVDVFEEWAIRTADYGDIRSRSTIEFEVTKDLLTSSPQPIRFLDTEVTDLLTDLTIDVDPNSPLLVTGKPGDIFEIRNPQTYLQETDITISQEDEFAGDFLNAGLPLTNETDYRILTKEEMISVFPDADNSNYTFEGEWKNITQWNNRQTYKFNDKVIYQGRTWAMLDPDGSSGLTKPNDPIKVTGTIALPVVPSNGETLIIDGTTVNLSKNASTTSLDIITVTGNQDIATSNVVTHGSTLSLGETSGLAQTIVFSNTVSTIQFQDIIKTGTIGNPSFIGSASSTLVIDGTTITFNDTVSTSTNITAQAVWENAFNTSWTVNTSNISSEATNRINALEALRTAYISSNSVGQWATFISSYYSASNSGLQISTLLNEYNTSPSYAAQLASLITSDVTIINNILNRSYISGQVIAGTTVINSQDITDSQNALANGQYMSDFKTWITTNTTVTLSTNTIITTQSGSGFKTYQISDIVQKINSAGIANLTASNVNSTLRLTKTTNDRSQSFSLTISGAGTLNSQVGFSTTTQTINSTSNNVITTPNLTIVQVVNQINAADISGITAQVSQANTNLLQINCNKPTLFIGTGNANNVVGITPGVIPAQTSVTNVSVALYINDIITSINTANIAGVSANQINNKVQITSVNETLVVGAGTANSTLGFQAQTYSATQNTISNLFNAIVGSDGNQVFREMENDPNIFSIWVADNSEQGSFNQGYAVYQTMDFGMHITKACAGIQAGDDAQIIVGRQTNDIQAHNLVAGDYVLIRGSTTVPNIDGIHKVTQVDASNTSLFRIDEYIEQEGGTGNVYPLRNVRFNSKAELDSEINSKQNNVYKYNFSGYRQNNLQNPIYIFVDNNGTGTPAVYEYTGTWSDATGHQLGSLKSIRTSEGQSRNDLINNVKIYDSKRKSTIAQIETWDPAKGIIPGFLRKEIDYLITADIADYNYNTLDGEINSNKSWGAEYTGKRWWNLNTAIYVNYEQSTIDYQQNNWGRLFDGSSIDIYEWTASPVLPEQWNILVENGTKINGVLASGEVYVEQIDGQDIYHWSESTYYNNKSNRNETNYYFWVKNKTSITGQQNYNTLQLSKILTSPQDYDISWVAASGANKLFVSNIDKYITTDSVIQVNQKYDSNSLPLNEWMLLAENDDSTIIPEYLHIKIRDSLASYNNYKQRFSYTTWTNSTIYSENSVVLEGNNYYISLTANNQSQQPSADSNQSYWSRIYDYNFVDETQQDDIDVWRGQMIPDLKLHKYNRYGHLVRPRQSLYRNVEDARQNFVHKTNQLLGSMNIIDQIQNWESTFNYTFVLGTVTYSTVNYWNWIDWHTPGYDTSIVADKTVANHTELLDLNDELDGTYVRVNSVPHSDGINRPEMYYYSAGTSSMVFKEKATIEISEEVWNQDKFGHGFDSSGYGLLPFDSDSSSIISTLFDNLRTNVFIGQHAKKYNQLWFSCLKQAVVQNTTDDFAFKTSYVKLQVTHPLLLAKNNYKQHDISVVDDYFNEIKPFHTKLHTSLERTTHSEANNIEVEETDRRSVITMKYEDHSTRTWAGDTILQGGTFTAGPDNVDAITFTTVDNTIEYVYNGNNFVQPVQEGWGNELVPQDYTENVSILVQTNASGSTETSDTRSFRIDMYMPQNIQESTVIVDATKTFLASGCDVTDTELDLNQVLAGMPLSGVVWIGTERIEYGAYDGGTLRYCTRGTRGTTAQAHAVNAVVNYEPTIPTLDNFAHYGDNLRMAYNDSGVSLSSAGITPEHAFIRNMGAGTI